MKPKLTRWTNTALAVLRRYLALDMTVYAGSATLFFAHSVLSPFDVGAAACQFDSRLLGGGVWPSCWRIFCPRSPRSRPPLCSFLQSLSGQSAQFVASLAVLTTIVSASGGVSALQVGLQRLTPAPAAPF